MKGKRTNGQVAKVTAWILSAALVFGACPLTSNAEGEEREQQVTEQSEETSEVISEKQTEEKREEREKSDELEGEEVETDATQPQTEGETQEAASTTQEETTQEETTQEEITETVMLWEKSRVALFSSARIGNVTETCPTIGENGMVTFHYYPSEGETITSAYVKGSWNSQWNDYLVMSEQGNGVWAVTTDKLLLNQSYEYGIVVSGSEGVEVWKGDQTNPNQNGNGNSKILRNPVANNDGSVTIYYYPQENESVELFYKDEVETSYQSKTLTKDTTYTALLSATISEAGTYTYYFEVNGEKVQDKNCQEAAFTISNLPQDDQSVKSPVVKDKEVTFYYYGPTAQKVFVAGNMNNWLDTESPMVYEESTGFWSLTLSLEPGNYQYKFVVDGIWMLDPRNDVQKDTNSAFTIASSNADVKSPVINANNTTATFFYENASAKTVSLAGQMNNWNSAKTPMSYNEETGFWSVSVKLVPGTYEYKFVVDENDWKTDPRNEETQNGNSVLTIKEKAYTYHIYYYSKDFSKASDAAMWIWQDGGAGGIQYDFDEQVTLSDGNQWLSADINIDLSAINIIPKKTDSWEGQDVTKAFPNEGDAKEVTIYLVDEDKSVYTSLPDVNQEVAYDRYVLIEYERPEKDYDGWNIYSWNTGIKSEYVAEFTQVNGKQVAYLPVDTTKESVAFCMRRSDDTDDWAQKDGGDHYVEIPLDQTIVKVRFVQGQGVVEHLPYNMGYETDTTNQSISFYFRDDEKYKNYEEDALNGKVSLVLNQQTYEMQYDKKTERYTVQVPLLDEGEYPYVFMVDGNRILDQYNKETIQVENEVYSLYKYKAFEITPSANVSPEKINYNENAVLSVSLGNEVADGIVIKQITADLSVLGLSSSFQIDPALMAGTIAVKDSVEAGEKTIPVAIRDRFGNIYKTEAKITVTKRTEKDDFDWDEAVIYFAVTDRFFDGNQTNNDAYGTGTYDPTQGSMYHGGDFAGITEKLDYLQELGVNTVWITPIVENTEYTTDCNGSENQRNAAYHGYWASDFTTLNQHLGTEQEFSTLVEELHKRGMKLMVDVVLNHAGYETADKFNDTYISGKNMLRDATNTVAGDDKKDALSGLPDFATEDSEVRDLLIEWQTSWISKYDIDYYRVDTVKHVDDTTWKAFKNELTKENPSFKMIGEYAGAGYASNFKQLGTGQMDALLDFDFNDQSLSFCNGKISEVEMFLENRNKRIDNTATLGSFLGSHDEDGFIYRLQKEYDKSQEDAYALGKVAATLQITAKGQPVIYYGEELGLTGANNYPYQDNRYDFTWEKANEENDMLTHYQTLLSIRNKYTDVFAKGTRTQLLADDENGILVVKRNAGQDTLYVGMNINPTQEKSVSVKIADGSETFTDLYTNKTYETNQQGILDITIPSAQNGGTFILVKGMTQDADKEISVNVSDTVNVDGDTTISISTTASAVIRLSEPTIRRIDGTIVRGWQAVIREYVEQSLQDMVPLASSLDGIQTQTIDIALDEHTIRVIPASAVNEMKQSGANFRFHVSDEIVYAYTNEMLQAVNGNLNLNMRINKEKDFGQGFQSVVIDPVTDGSNQIKVPVSVNLGKENAGKISFVFHRNLLTNKVEPLTFTWIDANGAIQIREAEYTDLIVLY